ncbi:flagellar biosynthesis protein FlhB [Vibrio algivorus]|uniref:Flagellar biosynthetic protein FlhB n=1 Tax=Vibrio algivorus TaxID=1667024 RepID=A0A557P2R3_9VIBR|nr:flagellar biosynthesis protein FlhB [Vibrio algivorus]TVO34917.1 flagellar biosynthesis protein FlhB [Vibrio algivorus]
MSDDKTEQASSKRLQQAREKGQIARAKEFTGAVTLIVALAYFINQGASLRTDLTHLFQASYTFDRTNVLNTGPSLMLLGEGLFLLIKLFAPLMVIQYVASIMSSSILGGISFNFAVISPKFSKLNPGAGFKRIFSSQTLIEFIKNVIKIALILSILYYMLEHNIGYLRGLMRASFNTVSNVSMELVIEIIVFLICVTILFGLIDVPYQKMTFNKQMRMSKSEVKQEHKEQEGNPEVKGRIRQIQMQNARRQATKTVPTADVVLMNPTHYAVAIKYDITKAEAPYVVARGKNEVAFYIKSLADKHEVEVLIVPALARSIYHTTKLEQMIPNQLFVAVAHILTYVNQLKSWKNGQHPKPNSLPSFSIPKELRY